MNPLRRSMTVTRTRDRRSARLCARVAPRLGSYPLTAADLQRILRDRWSWHLFWIRQIVLNCAKNDLKSRDFADKTVAASAKDIARTFTPFYGEAASDRLYSVLTQHYDAVAAYSEATVSGNTSQQEVALAELAAFHDEIADFFSGINPHLCPDTVRGLFAAYVDHFVDHITKLQDRDYAGAAETWLAIQHQMHMIADALTAAVVKQFRTQFSPSSAVGLMLQERR
jgi:hypothetical protein